MSSWHPDSSSSWCQQADSGHAPWKIWAHPYKCPSKQPIPYNKWTSLVEKVLETVGGSYQAMPQIYLSQLCSVACGFYWPTQEWCTSEKRMDGAELLPVWCGSPIMALSFTTQPCKTKLHEIDYPRTWTSFVSPPFPPALPLSPALCRACLFSRRRKINAPMMLTNEAMGY